MKNVEVGDVNITADKNINVNVNITAIEDLDHIRPN